MSPLLPHAVAAIAPLLALFAAPQLGEIADALGKRQQLFLESKSVHIKCAWGETRHLLLDDAAEKELLDILRARRFGEIAGKFPQQTIMRTPGYGYELAKLGDKLFERVTNPLDPKFGQVGTTGVFDGQVGLELQEDIHATIEADPPVNAYQHWEYALLQHFNFYKYVRGLDVRARFPRGMWPLNLPDDILQSPSEYAIKGEETVDGSTCVVLEKGDAYRFWLEPNRGYAIRRVDKYIPGRGRQLGSLKSSIRMADMREAKPGLWLPWAITEELYFNVESGPSNLLGKPALHRTLTVSTLEFDTLSDKFFEVPLPANVIVHDNIRGLQYRMETGGVPFAMAIDYAKGHLSGVGSRGALWALIAANLALLVLGGTLWRRHLKRPRA